MPGFDTARERFRRFLFEHVTALDDLRRLIQEAEHAPGSQHARALQDLSALLGRFLGFEVTFVPAGPLGAALRPLAHWRSARGVVLVFAPKAGMPWPTARQVDHAAADAAESMPAVLITGIKALVIVPPHVVTPAGHQPTLVDRDPQHTASTIPCCTIGMTSLAALAGLSAAGRVSHADVMQILEVGSALDGVVGVLARTAAPVDHGHAPTPAAAAELPSSPRTGFWLTTVIPDPAMSVEEFLEVVVARRHVFGIGDESSAAGNVRPGDGLCFMLPRRGVIGHARVAAALESGGGLRDARRFRQVVRLERIHLHVSTPLALDPESELRVRRLPVPSGRQPQLVVEISADSYRELTSRPSPGGTVVPFETTERPAAPAEEAVESSAGDGSEHDRNVL